MGLSSHSVEKFGTPFLMVDELVFVVPAGSTVNLTRHHFKFLFVLNGGISHEIDGIDGCLELAEGDILAAPPVKFHRYINPDPRNDARIHALRLFMDTDLIASKQSRVPSRPQISFVDFVTHHFSTPVHLKAGIDADIRADLSSLRKETELRLTGFRHRVNSLCRDLVVLVARKLTTNSRHPSSGATSGTVAAAREFIQKHFADADLRLGRIAFHTGKGDEHLARQFKRETGRSVFEFVREVRINHAKTLLLNPSLNLTTIAGLCGFQSLAFFSRSFKQLVGQSPSAYRRNLELHLKSAPTPNRSS